MRRIPIATVLLLIPSLGMAPSCDPARTPRETAPRGAEKGAGAGAATDAEIRAAIDRRGAEARAWLDSATLAVTARYREGSYPCIFDPDGSSVMPLARTLVIERVIRGSLAHKEIDFAAPPDPVERFPPRFAPARRYLALLRPSAEASAHLQDPVFTFNVDTALRPDQFVAVIDLDATAEEIAAHAREARDVRERLAFEFTKERWQALRASRAEDLEAVRRFQVAIARRELERLRRREDIHARFGPPDRTADEGGGPVDEYDLQPLLRQGAPEGALVGRFQLEYRPNGEVRAYREDFDIFAGGRLRPATYEEKKARGMSWTSIEWPDPGRAPDRAR